MAIAISGGIAGLRACNRHCDHMTFSQAREAMNASGACYMRNDGAGRWTVVQECDPE